MPDEPELNEKDPVTAIRKSLKQALQSLKNLLAQEKQEEQGLEKEVAGSGGQQTQPSDDGDDQSEGGTS